MPVHLRRDVNNQHHEFMLPISLRRTGVQMLQYCENRLVAEPVGLNDYEPTSYYEADTRCGPIHAFQ